MAERTYEVIVHKAALPLADGESLNQFMSLLNAAVKTYSAKKLAGGGKKIYPYMVETYSDSCVIDCYIPSDVTGSGSCYRFYAVPYTRDDDGTFNFGKMVEVVPVKSFQPVVGPPLASNTTGVSTADQSSIESTKMTTKALIAPNWEVAKSVWAGAL